MSLWSLAHENVVKNGGIFESDRKYSPGVVIRLWWLQPGLQLSLAARLSDWQGELLTLTSCLARLVRREERQTELGRCHCEVTVRSLSHWVTSACPAPLAARARLSWAWLAAPPPGALSSEHQAGGNSFNNVPEGYNTTQHNTTQHYTYTTGLATSSRPAPPHPLESSQPSCPQSKVYPSEFAAQFHYKT